MPREGETYPVTADWKRDRLAQLKKHGITRAELARRLNVTRGAISQLFKTARRSTLVPMVDQLLMSLGAEREMPDKEKQQVNAFLALLRDPQGAEPNYDLLAREYRKLQPDVRRAITGSLISHVQRALEDAHQAEIAIKHAEFEILRANERWQRAKIETRVASSQLAILKAIIDAVGE